MHSKHLTRVYEYTPFVVFACLKENCFFFFEIPSFHRFILAVERKRNVCQMSSLWQDVEDEAVVSRQCRRVNYLVHTLPGDLFRISLGEVELGSHWVPYAKSFYFFPPSSSRASFFLLRGNLSAPLYNAVSWGLKHWREWRPHACRVKSDLFHSICRNISENVFTAWEKCWGPVITGSQNHRLAWNFSWDQSLRTHLLAMTRLDTLEPADKCVFLLLATGNRQCAFFNIIYTLIIQPISK